MKSTIATNRKLPAQWGRIIGTGGLLLILYTTLFPFDFLFSHQSASFDFSFVTSDALVDYLRNILLFIPFSFGLVYLLLSRAKRYRQIVVVIVIFSGIGLSTMVEILQLFLSARNPSLADILANSIGTFCGLLIFYFWGEKLLNYLPRFPRMLLAAIITSHLMVMGVSYVSLTNATGLNNWDPSYPLLLGNEKNGDRPWQGSVSNLQIADYAISEKEISRVFNGEIVDSLIAYYPLTSTTSLADQTQQQPNLSWHGTRPTVPLETGVALDSNHWLRSHTPTTNLFRRLADTSQFTLSLMVTTTNLDQTGPARIVTLSANPFYRNFMVGQDGSDLIIRLRTPATGENGTKPELAIPNIFTDTQPHHLVILYNGATLDAYIDSLDQHYTFALTPHVTFFQYILPVDTWRIRISSAFLPVYGVLYYGLMMFIPLGYLLYLIIRFLGKEQPLPKRPTIID